MASTGASRSGSGGRTIRRMRMSEPSSIHAVTPMPNSPSANPGQPTVAAPCAASKPQVTVGRT